MARTLLLGWLHRLMPSIALADPEAPAAPAVALPDGFEFLPGNPEINVLADMISESDCLKMTAIAKDLRYTEGFDSEEAAAALTATNQRSEDLYIFDRGSPVHSPAADALWPFLAPLFPKLRNFVVANRGPTVLTPEGERQNLRLDWVSLREYGHFGNATGSSLVTRTDNAALTVTIELCPNDETDDASPGGGLFFVNVAAAGGETKNKPGIIPTQWEANSFVRGLTRRNTSAILFPYLPRGTAVLHNHTVWHGFAPIRPGARSYSLHAYFNFDNILLEHLAVLSQAASAQGLTTPVPVTTSVATLDACFINALPDDHEVFILSVAASYCS